MDDVTVDSGMDAKTLETAEWLWMQMPNLTRWHNQPTYVKALVCSLVRQIEAKALADAQGEAVGWGWAEKAIRDHCDEHGPSGGAWNISMILERLSRYAPQPAQDVEALVVKIGELAVLELDINDDDPRLSHFGDRLRTALAKHERTPHD